MDSAAVSRLVDRLEEEGLLKRCAGENRRCVHLQLTQSGQAEVGRFNQELEWLDGEVRQHLSASEAKTLARLLAKLHQSLAGSALPEAPVE